MPEYEFEDEKGRRVSVVLPMDEYVPFGEKREIGGKILTRVVELPAAKVVKEYRYPLMSAEPWTPGARRYDHMGTPMISSKKERDNVFAAAKERGYEHDK